MAEATQLREAPAALLDQLEEQRMDISDETLIAEAIEANHAGVGKDKTLDRYRDHLAHFSQYLASAHGKTFYSCRSKHVRLFMGHLARPGGPSPHSSRLSCE
jgi:site-specific recombinase XerD